MSKENNKYGYKYKMEELTSMAVDMLNRRGVDLKDIAEIVYFLQERYYPDLTMEMCLESIDAVLKREK